MPDRPAARCLTPSETVRYARAVAAAAAAPPDVHRKLSPEEAEALIEVSLPPVELTLVVTGPYTGPTRGRIVRQTEEGLYLLTERDGLFLVPWGNLAFARFL